jgi:DNA-binding MarR family transcriptional regulator
LGSFRSAIELHPQKYVLKSNELKRFLVAFLCCLSFGILDHIVKTQMPHFNAWLNLRNLLEVINAETDLKDLDPRTQRLLEWIVTNYSPEQPIFVQHIVMKSDVASPATIHKGLAILEREGLISVKVDLEDSRRRIVAPTEHAKKLMAKLSQKVKVWAETLQH